MAINKKCEWCKIKKALVSNGFRNHHLEMRMDEYGNKLGKTVMLCTFHHGQIHGYINKRSLEEIRKINPNFILEITQEYIDGLIQA